MENILLSADLGGAKLAVGAISVEGRLLHRLQEPTCQEGPEAGMAQMARLLRQIMREGDFAPSAVQAIGVAVPAVLAPETDLVLWAPNLPGWRDIPLRPRLEAELGLPVFLEYDGHAAALGEWWMGSGRGCQSLVALIIGSGIGGGMILDGRLYRGFNRLAGAAGWFNLASDLPPAEERARSLGFWEALAAGPGFSGYAARQAVNCPDSKLYAHLEQGTLAPEQIFSAAQQGDALAGKLVEQLAGWLGLGIANIVSLLNPERIVLSGGVGAHCEFLLPHIRQVVDRWAQPFSASSATLAVSQLGADAGLYGAAYSALGGFARDFLQ